MGYILILLDLSTSYSSLYLSTSACNDEDVEEDGAEVQGSRGDDDGSWRRDQVRDCDYQHRQGWRQGREEDGRNELESDSISRSSLIFGSDSEGSSSDYNSKYSSLPCLTTCRKRGWSDSGFREDWVPQYEYQRDTRLITRFWRLYQGEPCVAFLSKWFHG